MTHKTLDDEIGWIPEYNETNLERRERRRKEDETKVYRESSRICYVNKYWND